MLHPSTPSGTPTRTRQLASCHSKHIIPTSFTLKVSHEHLPSTLRRPSFFTTTTTPTPTPRPGPDRSTDLHPLPLFPTHLPQPISQHVTRNTSFRRHSHSNYLMSTSHRHSDDLRFSPPPPLPPRPAPGQIDRPICIPSPSSLRPRLYSFRSLPNPHPHPHLNPNPNPKLLIVEKIVVVAFNQA